MPTLTLKSIPDDLYRRLKRSAEDNRRSLNSEILVRLESALGFERADAEELLARVRAVRLRAAAEPGEPPLGDEQILQAKRDGRP